MSAYNIDIYGSLQEILEDRKLPSALDADMRAFSKKMTLARSDEEKETVIEDFSGKRLRKRLWDATNYDIVKKYDQLLKDLMR
jgi:hypothetical protein